jgi:chromosome partitioning protein
MTKKGITIGLCNQKGGAAKTTTTAALAAIFGERGLSVLVIDNDPQGHLSLQFGVDVLREGALKGTISELYLNKASVAELAVTTRFKGVELIPASVDAAAVEITLSTLAGSDRLLGFALKPHKSKYDLILLDSPPNLGKFAVNVLNASDYYLVPVDGPWALRSVDTLVKLAEQNARVYELSNQFLGVFLTMVDRTRIMQELRDETKQRFPDKLFKSEIRRSTLAREAAVLETPLPIYAADSNVAVDYRALADEIAKRIGL